MEVDPVGNRIYDFDVPLSELWFIEGLSTRADLVHVLHEIVFWGENDLQIVNQVDQFYQTLIDRCARFSLVAAGTEFLCFALIEDNSGSLNRKLVRDIFSFNEQVFGVSKSDAEIRDEIDNCCSKGVFSIGTL